ncbi:MFS transporter [Actinocrispum sp. NPDC049592]|uniref:MFS transporter n=1 Tax=Actinocrispum sp. NPDC049592 TaxID=3154835 RepID=UPI00342D0FD3
MKRPAPGWSILAASLPMFMVSLNNLVVTNALPAIRKDFGTDVAGLQWVVNGYVLAFASLLLTGAALGDRFGRRLVFLIGIAAFAYGSIGCAMSTSIPALIMARVVQGCGAAAVQPLSLTLLAAAVPERRRSAALGLWGGVNGLGVALGPVAGGAVTEGLAWQWIFWVNLPVAAVAVPLARWALAESWGRDRGLDLPGMVLVTAAVTLAVWGIVEAGQTGWDDQLVLSAFGSALGLLLVFVFWQKAAPNPLLPLRFYRIRAFVASNLLSLAMFFGVFGSIFFLAQYLQGPLGFAPLAAGLRTLPWTAMPMVFAPLAGLLTDRLGGGRLMTVGLALQGFGLAWIAVRVSPSVTYSQLVPALMVAGAGMGLVFGPTSAVVLGSVLPHEHGKASGANNTVREVGGALGVAVLTTVFSSKAPNPATGFLDGLVPALWVGVAVVALGVLAGLFIPSRRVPDLATIPFPRVRKEKYVGRHRLQT